MVISGAVAQWYFTANKAEDLPVAPCMRSTARAARYHLGSIAFGSMIIAIVQLVRVILEYIDRKTKAAQEKNRVLAVIIKCLRCLLWCFEKCIKFISCVVLLSLWTGVCCFKVVVVCLQQVCVHHYRDQGQEFLPSCGAGSRADCQQREASCCRGKHHVLAVPAGQNLHRVRVWVGRVRVAGES